MDETETAEERRARMAKDAYLKRTYNVSLVEWLGLLQFQGGVCAICGNPPVRKALHTEHDHKTGLVRGLCCFFCNAQILRQRVTPELLRRAADYLEDPPAVRFFGEERYGPKGRITSKRRTRRRRRRK